MIVYEAKSGMIPGLQPIQMQDEYRRMLVQAEAQAAARGFTTIYDYNDRLFAGMRLFEKFLEELAPSGKQRSDYAQYDLLFAHTFEAHMRMTRG